MPGNRQIFSTSINAADRYRWDGRWEEAMREYLRALAEFPEDATARGGLGFCYMQTKQWQKALEEYEGILKRDPSNVIALSKTAELYGILSRREDAYVAYLHLADLYSQAGQGARAEAAWQKAVQLSPGNPEPHERLASYYFEKKDIPSMIQQHLAAAQGYLLRNERGPARVQCEAVLRADAKNVQAQQLLAQILGEAERPLDSFPRGTRASYSPSMDSVYNAGPRGNRPGSVNGTSAFTGNSGINTVTSGNISGGNTGIMGNMGSAGNYGGISNSGQSAVAAGANGGMNTNSRNRISASQVTGVLKQAQVFQTQGRFNDAIDLCEQILESGFDRADARYFLGWLYQEQQRWDEAIRQFQQLLNDPDYALSCYYALGQCYRARGDLRTATVHFDEAVDRVNLDALTVEESDQLVQLCQEAAEAHRLLGEQEQALTVYNALLGFLRSRGWNDKVTQVEFMLQQAQNAAVPPRPITPPISPPRPTTEDQLAMQQRQTTLPPASFLDGATAALNTNRTQQPAPPPPVQQSPSQANSASELPDWLTGILGDADKTQLAKPPAKETPSQPPAANQLMAEQPGNMDMAQSRPAPANPLMEPPAAKQAAVSWMIDDPKPVDAVRAPVQQPPVQQPMAPPPVQQPVAPPPMQPVVPQMAVSAPPPAMEQPLLTVPPASSKPEPRQAAESLLSQMAGGGLRQVADAVLATTASLPENVRLQVVQSMQDIQKYINHGLLTSATEECLRVIDMAPQYLDVHQVLCEIYVQQGKVDQAITKYALLVDTYMAHGRTDDAVSTYRRILQLDPSNLTYRMRLISLLSSQGNREELLRERTLAAEAYLRLGYTDRALTELEQALQESPTSVPTRLNYALALQKLGRSQQAVVEYQRVVQVDPRNITALVRWHLAMISTLGSPRPTSLEVLSRIRWQLRGEGQKHAEAVAREYRQAIDINPNNADAHFALGQIYHQCGDYDKALDSYTLAIRDSSVEMLARVSAAQCLFSQGKPEAAIQQLEQALQNIRRLPTSMDPAIWAARPREEGEKHQAPEVEISLLLAKAYERMGRRDQMQAILQQLRQKQPVQDEVVSSLSEISARHGDVQSALQEYIDLVRHYRNSRQIDSALNVLNEMVRLAPQDPRAHEELADLYIHRGLLDEGIAELRLLADVYLRQNQLQQAAAAMQRVGNIYAETGNDEEALASLSRAVELDSSSMDLLRELVGLCLQLGKTQEAARYQTSMARHYFDTRQVKEAVAALQQLITIDRNNYDAYDMLGRTYQSVGEYEQASRVYRNLAKVNPGSPIARERLATLQELRTK